jgi:hypothetical protein
MVKRYWKWFVGIAGAVLLSAIGSALWDAVKPLWIGGRDALLNLVTFGISQYKDGMYATIAKGFHEDSSVEALPFLFLILLALVSMMFLGIANTSMRRAATNAKKTEVPDEQRHSQSGLKIKRSEDIKRQLRWEIRFFLIYLVFSSTLMIIDVIKESYVNSAITYYRQLVKIAAPALSPEDVEEIESKYARIKNMHDYQEVIHGLRDRITHANFESPPFSIW